MSPIPPEDDLPQRAREALGALWARLAERLREPACDFDDLKDPVLCVQRLSSAYQATLATEQKRKSETPETPRGLTAEDLRTIETKLNLM
ncbi:MAG: hypothetical protein ACFB21_04965 [Opitutales bacterium]